MKLGVTFTATALVLALTACQTTEDQRQQVAHASGCTTPLPQNLEITQPGADVPADLAGFVGKWGNGKWDGKLCHTLVVLGVNQGGNASAIYSWGTYAGWDVTQGNSRRVGTIENGKLTLERFGNGAEAAYWFEGDALRGSYTNARGDISLVKLTKLDVVAMSEATNADDIIGTFNGTWSNEHGNGGAFSLTVQKAADGNGYFASGRWGETGAMRARLLFDAEENSWRGKGKNADLSFKMANGKLSGTFYNRKHSVSGKFAF